ncbi:GNAT family N-acetyltransferase [Bradyrhizobium prioriisuperbiae]|uniref:GNAT family N-acetyltransferase n=1 Tax=Bradyrhizobium prioriisuperbiae TaxID=2854389 RepID=UPI0028E332BF|nr:GNAT family N-acetyltransferase [Bradyrhizobium prioritasuperba]
MALTELSSSALSSLSWRAEHACLNAWPALSNVFHDGWVARFADGLTRRANSINPLHGGAEMDGAILQFFENLFRAQDLPLIIRLPSLLDPAIDRQLEQLGYAAEGESRTIYGGIDELLMQGDPAARIQSEADESWLKLIHAMQGRTPAQSEIYEDIIQSIALPAAFASLRENGEVVAMAYAVLDGDLLCCESVVTSARQRGKGYGRRLMAALFHWAKLNQATGACLQVESHNTGGLALYRSLGMTTELHRYHYRRLPRG